jgi:integral membrane protein
MASLRTLRLVALLEGVSFLLLLFVAMPRKYLFEDPSWVRVVGMAHGVLFIAFVIVLVQAASEHGWPLKRASGAFVASLIPFGTFVLDRTLKREQQRLAGP